MVLPFLLVCCASRTSPEHQGYLPAFYKITFDSSMNILRAPLAVLDTARSLLKDVVEIGGRALDVRPDTIVIAPSYVLLKNRQHSEQSHKIRTNGPQALPDFLLVPVQPGVHIEPWNPREKQFISRIFPIVFLLGVLFYLRHAYYH